MKVNKNWGFSINVSVEAYESKIEAGKCLYKAGAKELGREKMAFWERQVTADEFLGYATSGHTFCALFECDPNQEYWIEDRKMRIKPVYCRGKNMGAMKICMKRDQFFRGAQVIFVDVDYTRFSDVKEYISVLTYKPTCVYMSYSDNIDKGGVRSRRFRLVYVFDRILDANEFIWVSSAITRQIEQDTGEPMEDKCGERRSQYMNGVFGNTETYKTDIIYSVYDFLFQQPQSVVIQHEIQVAAPPPQIVFSDKLVYEMEHLPYETFIHYYSWMGYVYRTEKPEWTDNLYQMTDENYLQIWFCREKVMDGQHRRSKLYRNACLRRLIDPEMKPDAALFNLYVDARRFFDNSDGVLNTDTLMNKVKKAFETPIEKIASECIEDINYWHEHRPKFIIKNIGIGNRGSVKYVKGLITYAYLDAVYAPFLSVQENARIITAVSEKTLYRYARNRKISTNPHKQPSERDRRAEKKQGKAAKIELFQQLYCPNLSLSQNGELLKEAGLNLPKSTIANWAKKYVGKEKEPERPFTQPQTIDNPFKIDFSEFNWNWYGSTSELGESSLF